VAGVLTSLVGFTSSFAVVLAGLASMGATPGQAASGLLALCVVCGVGTVWLSARHRIPVILAWSTPGAALLASTGTPDGGWPAAVGAFALVGVLVLLTGLWPRLGEVIAAIPTPIAQAMLAGVLLQLCLAPVVGLAAEPLLVAPVVAAWLVAYLWSARWASPVAFVVALGVIGVWLARHGAAPGSLAPVVDWTTPTLSVGAVLGVALPLYVVTMASQNVPGVAVLSSYGFTAPWRASMGVTGVGTVVGAPLGGHAVNLAAITAALAAGPESDPDPRRRWLAGQTSGATYLVLAVLSGAVVTLVTTAPIEVITAVAGLALLATLASALTAAMADVTRRLPAVVTFVVAGSGVSVLGIGAAFWALAAGLLVAWLEGSGPREWIALRSR
jgi:benzoate membrane transport protein